MSGRLFHSFRPAAANIIILRLKLAHDSYTLSSRPLHCCYHSLSTQWVT